jgi:hypothetical protein
MKNTTKKLTSKLMNKSEYRDAILFQKLKQNENGKINWKDN